jgi:hypothetical protein
LYLDPKQTRSYLISAEKKRIASEGFGLLGSGNSFQYLQVLTEEDDADILDSGCLFVVEAGTESAKSV